MTVHRPAAGDAVAGAAQALATALREGRRIAALPSAEPLGLTAAYAVQDALAAAAGPVGGWKVGPLRDGEARCSPLPHAFFRHSPATFAMAATRGWLVEAEIAVRFGRDVRAGGTADILRAIGTVHPAIECVSSRFQDPGGTPDLHRLADLQNAGAVVLGPGVAAWHGIEFSELAVTLDLDGTPVPGAASSPSTSATLDALCWLARHAAGRGLPLREGDVVITGARLGAVPLAGHRIARAAFPGIGSVQLACA